MLALALILLSQVTPDSRVSRVERVPGGRMEGGRGGVKGWAFFEAFPVGGAGTTTACSTTAPTGAKGETLTFTRGSVATCTATATGGLVSSGIANGDLVELSSNVARVEYDSAGVKGLRVEGSGQNVLPRFIDYTNGSWADVGTPTPTTGQASPFSGTYANSAVLYDDNDAAAFEGRTTTINTTPSSAYIAHCYVKAGTATSARIVLDGTAATITGLSSSTWSIVEVADASASAASVTFEVDVGSTAATTGSVVLGGCDVKLGTFRSSIVPTVAAAVTRSADNPPVASVTPSTVATGCMSLRVQLFTTATNGLMAADATGAWKQGLITFGGQRAYIGAVSMVGPLTALTAGAHTASMRWDGSSTTMVLDGSPTVGAAGTPVATNQIIIGGYNGGNLEPGLYSRIQYDTSPTRCTP